jgi:hypothetical protein
MRPDFFGQDNFSKIVANQEKLWRVSNYKYLVMMISALGANRARLQPQKTESIGEPLQRVK